MLLTIIIFFIAIISLFGMLMFRAWEIKKVEWKNPISNRKVVPEIYFRHVEKIVLYLAKYVVQSIIFVSMKYWFIALTKTKKWLWRSWPRFYKFFHKKEENIEPRDNSFFRKAVLESKAKIKKIKENVRKEHGEIK